MKKILTTFSISVICLFVLALFGWMVSHMVEGDKEFGFLEGPVEFMYTFPDMFSQSVEEVKTLPKTFVPTPEQFIPINKLERDFLVLATYSDTGDTRSIVLRNLRNDSILYQWRVENPFREHDRIFNPLLLPDKDLVYSFEGVSGLRRIDSLGKLRWKQDSVYAHHAMNLDSEGNIWICGFAPTFLATGWYKLQGRTVFFKDNFIARIDAETGRILFHKSIVDILRENKLEGLLLKTMAITDPIHLNDVQPALKTTAYYQEGDLFISNRSPSHVIHYRPSTNQVIRVIEGVFVSQHDVDFLDDESLVIFNNNYYSLNSKASRPPPRDSSWLRWGGDHYSNLVRYDFKTQELSYIGDSLFRANHIFTRTEGLQEFTGPGTYFVEEQNAGLLWVMEGEEVLYKGVFESQHAGYHHLPNWNRVIQDYD